MGDDAETIEYWFGDGAGDVSRWTSPSSHGTLLLDFDGDGRVDDAMIDLDGDRRADVAALDLDDDGTAETRHRDDGSGLWAVADVAPSNCPVPRGPGESAPSKPEPDARVTPVPAEPGQPPRQAVIDADADGDPDALLFDTDGDGTADGAVSTGAAGPTPAPAGTPQAR